MTEATHWRLFVAAELPASLRRDLARLGRRLSRRLPDDAIRWLPPASIHLTLRFLGPVLPSRVPVITGALETAAAACRALTLRLAGLGSFAGSRSPRVIWVGLKGDERGLRGLAGAVRECLEMAGFPREERPFRPHLTLGRVRDRLAACDRDALGAALTSFRPPPFAPVRVTGMVLFRSHLGPGGARHEPLIRLPLAG
ncbi:MAG: RNA 2',3'-cyclic phosphodiesterase [Acidobacteria bacterium]|nr:RNA 2',3'-cyclic phosphodiesterase [Acidobacteriota bacterium]MCZ6833879.1 RNA 2',3'-cyclic phosphodiesterase [Acidobacteriota bacterium]